MPQSDAGWRIDPPVSVPSETGASQAATAAAEPPDGAAGDAVQVPRVACRLVGAVLGGRAHRELVHVRLADQDGVGGLERRNHVGVVGWLEGLEHLRAARRGYAAGAKHVLDGDWYAGQAAERLASPALRVHCPCLGERVWLRPRAGTL